MHWTDFEMGKRKTQKHLLSYGSWSLKEGETVRGVIATPSLLISLLYTKTHTTQSRSFPTLLFIDRF